MSKRPRAMVIRTAGTNCDAEMVRAFELAGADAELAHVDRLIQRPASLERCDLIGFPGGFSYGDDIASGRVLALKARLGLLDQLTGAAERGVPIIGVCNGFQVLCQLGLLPGGVEPDASAPVEQTAALAENASARFIDDWTPIELPESRCIWTRDLWDDPTHAAAALRMPIAHGEGRFVTSTDESLDAIENNGQVAMRYAGDVNGSVNRIAGVCDRTGLVFGLMPHPERYASWSHHPFWTRLDPNMRRVATPGLKVFQNAVAHVRSGAAQRAGVA